jgi:hypothetical protein
LIFKIGFKNQVGFYFIFSFKIFSTDIELKKKVGSSKYLGNYYPLDIKDDYHILDNEIHQFYYKQSIYKGFILLKLTFKFLTLQSAKE